MKILKSRTKLTNIKFKLKEDRSRITVYLTWKVPLVAQDQDGYPRQLRPVQEIVQLIPARLDLVGVRGVHHVHDRVHPAAVPLPHRPEPRLAADVPQLYRHVPLGDLPHVEAHSRDHVLIELARGNHIHKRGLPCANRI